MAQANTVDYLSAQSVLTTPAARSLSCPTCSGAGCFGDGGPVTTDCRACSGSGIAKCRECPSQAEVVDANAEGDGPACLDCAARCIYCQAVATQLVTVTDDQGECERDEALCDRCAEEEEERAARIKRVKPALERGDAWAPEAA